MHTHHERGIALVLALFLMSALSVLAASLMFLSQTETYASMNYRMMSQARYAGEGGVHKAANFLLDPTQYAEPSGSALLLYDRTVSPVTYLGQPVILSASSDQLPNYPDAAIQTAFNAAGQGSLTAGDATLNYSSYATLIAMQVFDSYGGGAEVVQTWQVTGVGELSGSRNATVEVVAMIETPKVPANSYGAFGTDAGCGALTFGGNVTINSYNSSDLDSGESPTMSTSGGDVGSNGNLTISGSVEVQGNLYTPRTGVGTCEEGAVTALTESGNAEVLGSTVQLPTTVSYPDPDVPAPSPIAAQNISSSGTTATTCVDLGLIPVVQCNVVGDDIIIDGGGSTLSLPSVSLTSHVNLVLVASNPAAEYNFNSISLNGGAAISVKATSSSQGVLVNVVGKNPDNTDIETPIDFAGGTYAAVNSCDSCTPVAEISEYDASMLQFVYGGTGTINMTGNSGAAATFYAPNAYFELGGTADIYGSILASRINLTGSGNIHYDQQLQSELWVAGQALTTSFTWKRY